MTLSKNTVATYLTDAEKAWLKQAAARESRSMASELRMLVRREMEKERK